MAIFAQAPATTTPPPTINQRKENKQDRIAQGIKSGQLTAGETSRHEYQEAGINKEEQGMRAQGDNGHLTKQDRKTIKQQAKPGVQTDLSRQTQRQESLASQKTKATPKKLFNGPTSQSKSVS
jgi:hypothetical protein